MLTGRFRFRKGWFGRCVLEVQERYRTGGCMAFPAGIARNRWRDASPDEAYDIMMATGGCFR